MQAWLLCRHADTACWALVQGFTGERSGWVFKAGELGLGYYKDPVPSGDQPVKDSSCVMEETQAGCVNYAQVVMLLVEDFLLTTR